MTSLFANFADNMNENTNNHISNVLQVASEAGHIMLENGAEISRVEETMERISDNFGVKEKNFFVLSNGIITTGDSGVGSESFAKVEYIPIKGTQLEKVVEVNTLSRDIASGRYTVEQASERIKEIKAMPAKPFLQQIIGSAIGSAGFCVLFGGSFIDAAAAFIVGLLLWIFVLSLSKPGVSKMMLNIAGGTLATLICYALYKIGFGENLGNMMIGSLIPLIPGVPFTNGIRDLANEDYLAGITRLLDAIMVFLCISIGVVVFFVLQGHVTGSVIELHGSVQNPFTANIPVQALAAFLGTIGFAVLFGVPKNRYLSCGIVAMIGWAFYYALYKYSTLSVFENTFLTSCLVTALSRRAAIMLKTPLTVFLICGLFPLIPGAGVFWSTYYITSNQLSQALSSGLNAVSITLAIVLAIIIVTGIQNLISSHHKPKFTVRDDPQ